MQNPSFPAGNNYEDRFTTALANLIDYIPEIGQALVDLLLSSSSRGHDRFVKCTDHPYLSSKDRPDFMLSCEGCDILLEYKIESELGKAQLERYLQLAKNQTKPTLLALISNRPLNVSEAVLSDPIYLKPTDSIRPHFLWSAVYPIVASHNDPIAMDFLKYMDSLWMRPWEIGRWGNLFEGSDADREFIRHLEGVSNHFRQLRATCLIDKSFLSLQIRRPLPWLSLIFLQAEHNSQPPVEGMFSPHVRVNFWIKMERSELAAFNGLFEECDLGGIPAIAFASPLVANWDSKLHRACSYITSLENILDDDQGITGKKLFAFTRGSFDHAKRLVALARG